MAALLEHVDHAIAADQMQRSYDDEITAAILEITLERLCPSAIALRHERVVETRKVVELCQQLAAQDVSDGLRATRLLARSSIRVRQSSSCTV